MRQALILVLILALATGAAAAGLVVRVPAGIGLPESRARERLAGTVAGATGRYDSFEIVIYHYSLGTETYSYSEEDPIRESRTRGGIRALVKCRKGGVLARALFVEAEGDDEAQILDGLRRAVAEAVSRL